MLSSSERQTIQEVLQASKMHKKALQDELQDRATGHDPNRLMDVNMGLAISISKLETILKLSEGNV
jgi:hypothetical protein